MTPTLRMALLAVLAGSFVLAGCGAGDQLSRINPFSGMNRDDPDAPPRDQRVPVLGLSESLETDGETRVVLPPAE